jgi:hypothetical protein|tara:strand:- start:7827 stop:8861 length:1035 start_codon:yes stop_codon:yes gene_type:complete
VITDYTKNGISNDDPDVVKGRAGSPYAVKDYYNVNPDLAENVENRLEEFKSLIERSHAVGLKVIIDIVPNHVARNYQSLSSPEGVEGFGENDDKNVVYHVNNNFYYNPKEPFNVPKWENGYSPLGAEKHPLEDHKFDEIPAKWTGNGSRLSQPIFTDWYETIKIYGLLQPIIVDKKTNYIISGNRRFQACSNLGLKKVKVIKSSFDYDVIALINFNKYRTKTTIEKVNEYRMMKTQIKKMGYKDRKKIMGGVGMRDYIFQQTGVSQKTEHQLSFVEDKNPKLAEMVLTGEISIKRAYQEIKKNDSPNGIDIKGDLSDLETILKKLYPNVDYSKIEKIVNRVYGK